MDEYDFRKIDREIERELRDSNNIFDCNPRMTDERPPSITELMWVDGRIYIEVPNPEYNCEVIID